VLLTVLFFSMGKQVVFIFKSRLLSLYTAQWCDFLRALMVVTLVGLLMITRKENLYHLMILSCILTRLRNQSCKSSMISLIIFDQYACFSLHISWFDGEMIWLYCYSII
jgi:fatty acid desaturase